MTPITNTNIMFSAQTATAIRTKLTESTHETVSDNLEYLLTIVDAYEQSGFRFGFQDVTKLADARTLRKLQLTRDNAADFALSGKTANFMSKVVDAEEWRTEDGANL